MKRILVIIPIVILAFSLNYLPKINAKSNSIKNASVFSVKSNKNDDKKCSFCHTDILKHEMLHAPVADDCESCHQSTGNIHPRANLQGFTLAEKTPDLCYICHEQKNTLRNIHAPVESGDCNSCHSPHGAKYQNLLSKSTTSEVCAVCHDLDFKKKSNIHAPIELDGCQSCHDSHQSDHSYLLIEEKSKLCITCHVNIEEEKKLVFLHAPFDDNCSNCHSPHNSIERSLLTTSSPGLCFNCHDDIGSKLKDSKSVHLVATDQKNCSNCHSPHASSFSKILIKEQTSLCLNCHNEEINSASKILENIKEKLQNSKFKHAPIEGEGCSVCHDPHASDHISLLTDAFPEDEYAKANIETFALCFNCHDTELLIKEYTKTSTNFRNGDLNLHFVHINGDKGRNCNICHDMHASNSKYLIKKRTKYGNWDMPMNFLLQENGASCRTGCHTEKRYDRIKPIFYGTNSANKDSINNNQNIIVKDSAEISIIKMDTIREIVYIEDLKSDSIKSEPDFVKKDSVISTNDTLVMISDLEDTIITDEDTIGIKEDTIFIAPDLVNLEPKDSIIELINKPIITSKEAFERMMPLRMYFKYAKNELAKNADEEILKLINFMNEFPEIILEIHGHTDNIGSEAYNEALSRERALAVKKFLNANGILPKRIQIISDGELHPIDTNDTDEGRANNRRVEFKLKNEKY